MNPFRTEQDVVRKNPFDGAEARIVHGENMSLATWRFRAGTVLPAHQHPHEQVTLVVEGSLELSISGNSRKLSTGEGAVIPGDTEHQARAITDCVVADSFYPVREDLR